MQSKYHQSVSIFVGVMPLLELESNVVSDVDIIVLISSSTTLYLCLRHVPGSARA